MQPVGLGNTGVLTDYAQKSPRTPPDRNVGIGLQKFGSWKWSSQHGHMKKCPTESHRSEKMDVLHPTTVTISWSCMYFSYQPKGWRHKTLCYVRRAGLHAWQAQPTSIHNHIVINHPRNGDRIWMIPFALLTFITESKLYLPTLFFCFLEVLKKWLTCVTIIGGEGATYEWMIFHIFIQIWAPSIHI